MVAPQMNTKITPKVANPQAGGFKIVWLITVKHDFNMEILETFEAGVC
jgi:hypothetical protein